MMRRYKVIVRLEKTTRIRETFYVDAPDERTARQEALDSADAAYPEYDAAFAERVSGIEGDEE